MGLFEKAKIKMWGIKNDICPEVRDCLAALSDNNNDLDLEAKIVEMSLKHIDWTDSKKTANPCYFELIEKYVPSILNGGGIFKRELLQEIAQKYGEAGKKEIISAMGETFHEKLRKHNAAIANKGLKADVMSNYDVNFCTEFIAKYGV